MGWATDYLTGTDLHDLDHVWAFSRALRERNTAARGGPNWPRHNYPWVEGTITGITATSMTDSAATGWIVPNPGGPGTTTRWFDYQDDDSPFLPRYYDVVLNCDDPDPRNHVHAQITGHTSTVLSFASIDDWVTAGYLPSVAWLVGKRYTIVKRNGLWWGKRWIKGPNDREAWRGVGASVTRVLLSGTVPSVGDAATLQTGPTGSPTGSHGIYFTADGAAVLPWSGTVAASGAARLIVGGTTVYEGTITDVEDGLYSDLIRFDAGDPPHAQDVLAHADVLRRVSVLGYTSSIIRFARQSVALTGAFTVVAEGGKAWPGHESGAFAWYGGRLEATYTHRPADLLFRTDGLSTVPTAAATIRLSEGGPVPGGAIVCTDVTKPALDIDVWSDLQEYCGPADECYSPGLFSTPRGWQLAVENLCGSFVPADDYTRAKRINRFTFAGLCKHIDLNYLGTPTATADSGGTATFSSSADAGETLVYELRRIEDDFPVASGTLTTGSGGSITISGLTAGKAYGIILSRGWTRRFRTELMHAYPSSVFVPSIETDDFGGRAVVVPPTHEYPGVWVTHPASTTYKVYDDQGRALNGPDAIVTGRRCRYVGDTWNDASVRPWTVAGEDGPLDSLYWANLHEGRFHKTVRPAYEAHKRATATYGGPTWLRCDAASWWSHPIGDGVMRTESGTASHDGDVGQLRDATKTYTDPETSITSVHAFWADVGRWVGHSLAITRTVNNVDGDPVQVETRTIITGQPGGATLGTQQVTFATVPAYTIPEIPETSTTPRVPAVNVPALTTIAAGTAYAIREPLRRNWWAGRTVRITPTTGEAVERIVTHSDDKQLWWGEALPEGFVVAGASVTLVELEPGRVYEWDGSAWVDPTDNPRDLDTRMLISHPVTRYGRMRNGDELAPVLNELYRAINALQWTLEGVAWANPGSAPNTYEVYVSNAGTEDPGFSDIYNAMVARYTLEVNGGEDEKGDPVDPLPPTLTVGPPVLKLETLLQSSASELDYLQRLAAAVVEPPVGIPRSVDVYAVGLIDIDDPDEDANHHFQPHGLSLLHRERSVLVSLPTSSAATLTSALLNAPLEAVVPGFGGMDVDGGGTFVEGFVITGTDAVVKWQFEYLE